jgi:ankyrin repeat protein
MSHLRNLSEIAMFGSYDEMREALLNAGLEQLNRIDNEGYTLLGQASKYGNIETLSLLLEFGADLDLCDLNRGGAPPIHAALTHRHREAIFFLLDRGASLDSIGWMSITGREKLSSYVSRFPNAIDQSLLSKYLSKK